MIHEKRFIIFKIPKSEIGFFFEINQYMSQKEYFFLDYSGKRNLIYKMRFL